MTESGKLVHAQIQYNDISIISRTTSGQLRAALEDKELAIHKDGTFSAPIDLIVHSLHPYTNNKIFDLKVDAWTNLNGFDTQNMSTVSLALRRDAATDQSLLAYDRVSQVLGLLGYRIKFRTPDQPCGFLRHDKRPMDDDESDENTEDDDEISVKRRRTDDRPEKYDDDTSFKCRKDPMEDDDDIPFKRRKIDDLSEEEDDDDDDDMGEDELPEEPFEVDDDSSFEEEVNDKFNND